MNRTQTVLAGLLLIQLLLILLVRSPFAGGTDVTEARPLLPGLEAITPERIELIGADESRINLRNREGVWVVEEAGNFPADAQKIEGLLDDLRGLEVRRPVVSSNRYHATFKVGDDAFEGRLRIWAEGSDEPEVDLILGDSPNYRLTHARLAGEDRVFEVRGIAPYDVRAASSAWARKELTDVPVDRVTGVRLTNALGTLELVKEDDVWRIREPEDLADQPLDQEKVEALIRAAASLRMDEPVGPVDEAAQGLDAPAATVVLRWLPGDGAVAEADDAPAATPEQVVVRVGGAVADKETQRYVTRSGFQFTGTIWDSSVKTLIEQDAKELIAS